MVPSLKTMLSTTEYGVEVSHISEDKKFKSHASPGKVMLLLFWDCSGPGILS